MSGGKKLSVVLAVLITGVSAAFFFRKDASQQTTWQEAQGETAFHQRVERRVAAGAAWANDRQTRPTAARTRQALRVPASPTAAISKSHSGAEHHPVVQRNFNPVGALLEPIEGFVSPDADADSLDVPLSTSANNTLYEETPSTHRIVDGDTLSKLAAEYLGRSDRYMEIFEFNRPLLNSPDLLPIGTVLKIPPQHRPSASPDIRNSPTTALERSGGTSLQLVPVVSPPARTEEE